AERVPVYVVWHEHAEAIGQFSEALGRIQPDGVFGQHPLRRVSPTLLDEDRPVKRLSRAVDSVGALLRDMEAVLKAGGPAAAADPPGKMAALPDYVEPVAPLAGPAPPSPAERASTRSQRARALAAQHPAAAHPP